MMLSTAYIIHTVHFSCHTLQYFFADTLSREARQEAQESLRLYFLVLILLDFVFICYMACALCATKKYYREMRSETRGPFQARVGEGNWGGGRGR